MYDGSWPHFSVPNRQCITDAVGNVVNPLNAELNPIRHLLALVGARHIVHFSRIRVNPLNAELNPIHHLLALVGARHIVHVSRIRVNPLNAELNPIRHLLALVGARHIVHVSRIRVNKPRRWIRHSQPINSHRLSLTKWDVNVWAFSLQKALSFGSPIHANETQFTDCYWITVTVVSSGTIVYSIPTSLLWFQDFRYSNKNFTQKRLRENSILLEHNKSFTKYLI